MGMLGMGNETYLYLCGIKTSNEFCLRDNIFLVPHNGELNVDDVAKIVKSDVEFGVALLFAKSLSTSLKIVANNSKELAVSSWNALWDLVLLSAVFHNEVICNFQSNHSVEQFNKTSMLHITNYHLRGFNSKTHDLTHDDILWLEKHFANGIKLLEQNPFTVAVHSMATYKWHSLPRVQLAIIWAGIEALFAVSNEIAFRLSLNVSKFLSSPDSADETHHLFKVVKKLYGIRSKAVHGDKIKAGESKAVCDSAELLHKLIIKIVEINSLPDEESLIF